MEDVGISRRRSFGMTIGCRLFAQRGHTIGLRRAACRASPQLPRSARRPREATRATTGSTRRCATLASGAKTMCAFKRGNLVNVILGGLATDSRIRAGTQAVSVRDRCQASFGIGRAEPARRY